LDKIPCPERDPNADLRIPIYDKIKEKAGFYVFGKIETGCIKIN